MTAWLAETLVGTTLLMLVVLTIRSGVARAFGARWAYALWALPALRIILPPFQDIFPDAPLPPVVMFIPTTELLTAPPSGQAATSWEWVPFILALWAGGAVIFLTLQWLAYREFLHRLSVSARPGRPPVHDGIPVFVSGEVEGPIAVGLTECKVVVPADFRRRYSPDEQRLALDHELVHHRRGDLWWNLAALLVLALNWFNPVAWYAFRAFRSDQELACDAAVAAGASPDERHDYARALVKSATRPGLIAVCPLTRAGQLKHRLRMMRSHRVSPWRSLGGGMATFAMGGLCFVLGTPGFSHRKPQEIMYLAAPPAGTVPVRTAAASAPQPVGRPQAAHTRLLSPARVRRPVSARAPAPDPLMVAAATTPELPNVELPKLATLDWSEVVRSRTQQRTIVRVAHVPAYTVRIRSASTAAVGMSDLKMKKRLEVVNLLMTKLREESLSDAELDSLKKVIERLDGNVKGKIMHSVLGEIEI